MQAPDLRNNLFVFVSPEDFISLRSGKQIKLDAENLHHIRTVLRQTGELNINVSAGDGKIIETKLTVENKIQKADEGVFEFSRPIKTSLITPGIKRKNLDLLLQKITEIGVDFVYFINSNYQNFPVENSEKLRKTAISACIQSKNPFLPVMEKRNYGIEKFPFREDVFYFWGDPDHETGIEKLSPSDIQSFTEVCFINGCEGGWSPAETEFLKNRFRSVRLSDNVLRAETAALVALFYIKLLIRDSLKK